MRPGPQVVVLSLKVGVRREGRDADVERGRWQRVDVVWIQSVKVVGACGAVERAGEDASHFDGNRGEQEEQEDGAEDGARYEAVIPPSERAVLGSNRRRVFLLDNIRSSIREVDNNDQLY